MTIFNEYKESIQIRIDLINKEINELKNAFDIITKNTLLIEQFENYPINKIAYWAQHQNSDLMKSISDPSFALGVNVLYSIILSFYKCNYNASINTLVPNFIDFHHSSSIKEVDGFNSIKFSLEKKKLIFEEYFSDHKIVEEIAEALLIKKQNQHEKLISKYGTLDIINKKLSKLFFQKIELLHLLEFDDFNKEDIKEDKVMKTEKNEKEKRIRKKEEERMRKKEEESMRKKEEERIRKKEEKYELDSGDETSNDEKIKKDILDEPFRKEKDKLAQLKRYLDECERSLCEKENYKIEVNVTKEKHIQKNNKDEDRKKIEIFDDTSSLESDSTDYTTSDKTDPSSDYKSFHEFTI